MAWAAAEACEVWRMRPGLEGSFRCSVLATACLPMGYLRYQLVAAATYLRLRLRFADSAQCPARGGQAEKGEWWKPGKDVAINPLNPSFASLPFV